MNLNVAQQDARTYGRTLAIVIHRKTFALYGIGECRTHLLTKVEVYLTYIPSTLSRFGHGGCGQHLQLHLLGHLNGVGKERRVARLIIIIAVIAQQIADAITFGIK